MEGAKGTRSHYGGPRSNTPGVVIHRGDLITDGPTGRRLCEDRGGDQGDVSRQQGMRDASRPPEAGRRGRDPPTQPCSLRVKVLVKLLATQSCPTLCDPMDCSPPGSSVHGDSPGKNTGVGCRVLLQGIFPTQGLNLGLLHCRWILCQLSYRESSYFPYH